MSVSVSLSDGSLLRGQLLLARVPLETSYARLALEPALLEAIEFDHQEGTALVLLQNGDRLRGKLPIAEVKLHTSFGEITLPCALIKRMVVERQRLMADLVLYYSFDHQHEKDVRNEAGNLCHGTYNRARWVPKGKVGGGVYFPGMGAHVLIPNQGQLDFGREDFSYAFWFNAESTGSRQQLAWHHFNPEIQIEPDGAINAYFAHPSCGAFSSKTRVTSGQWYHVVVTREKGTGVLYLNGRREATIDAAQCDCSSPNPWLLGTDERMGEHFVGLLDEFAIWRRALSETEVENLFNVGRPVGQPTAR